MKIVGRAVWFEEPPYTVAEMSGNHSGNISHAFRRLGAAKVVEADTVKIKTYRAETITIDHLICRVAQIRKAIIISMAIASNSIGTPAMKPVKSEQTVWKNRSSSSIVALMRKWQLPDHANMRSILQGGGFMSTYLEQVISRKIRQDFPFGQPMNASVATGGLAP